VCILYALLRVIHDRREDDDGHGEGEEKKAELGGAALERVAQDPEAGRVAGKLKYPKTHTKSSIR